MAKRVRQAEQIGVRINTTQLAILREMRHQTVGGAARVSNDSLGRTVGVCHATVITSIRGLVQQGLVMIERRYLANGGQLENGYAVTDLGQQVLDASTEVA